jgi:DNA-binding XRE family transcriptional regulator
MDPQFFKTPGGEEMVILSRSEYDTMMERLAEFEEDADDIAIYDARKADLEAGRDERLPVEVSAYLIRGFSLVTAVRKWRGVKQTDLAERAGVSQGYLSDIESRRRKGAPETLTAIAKALDVPDDWLVTK